MKLGRSFGLKLHHHRHQGFARIGGALAGPTFEKITRLATTMTGINFMTHILGCFLMTLNRFTVVCLPHRHRDIWQAWKLSIYLTIAITISIAIHIEGLIENFIFEISADGRWIRVGRSGSLEVRTGPHFALE
ncbi:unnamed protein product [Haemonchus placei]|uniref:Serpentine receptor class gamma n=1 Tax=Haemonchus placei TaxID=6290 RepID=A0A0N4W9Z1_HAEPC|nr:unnamed protein product [Haemonchus placei]